MPVLDSRVGGRTYTRLKRYGANAAITSFCCKQPSKVFNSQCHEPSMDTPDGVLDDPIDPL
jgi:hypothetical protein